MEISQLKTLFKEKFGEDPVIVRSPGRVNLIGEHTDYNNGFVFPAAIDKYVDFAVAPAEESHIEIIAHDLGEAFDTRLETIERTGRWPDYLLGVLDQLQKDGRKLGGLRCLFSSNVPIGAGMSSSAAIECGITYALNNIFELKMEPLEMIMISQKAENKFVGMQCGIMDQFASMMGQENKAFKLDCRSLEYQYVPFDFPDHELLLINSMVKHQLTHSGYNDRRSECEAVVQELRLNGNEVNSLRDVSFEMLEMYTRYLDPVMVRRATYVLEENLRVQQFLKALSKKNIELAGKLMYASHHGLRHQYEVSCAELDYLVELTLDIDGIEGARMMGGGFGGCTINLIRKESTSQAIQLISESFQKEFGDRPEHYIVRPGRGTHLI